MLSDAAQVIAILSSTVADFDETNELVSRFFWVFDMVDVLDCCVRYLCVIRLI